MMQHLLPAAVSGWPPGAPRSTPSEAGEHVHVEAGVDLQGGQHYEVQAVHKGPLVGRVGVLEALIS